MSARAAPLVPARLAALSMSSAFGIIGMGVGINALAKYVSQKHALQRMVPAGATLTIDTTDILSSGIVLTIVCGLVALLSFLALAAQVLAPHRVTPRMLRLQAGAMAFLAVWCFAVLVAFTDIFANRSAKVAAFLGSVPIPESIIQQMQAQVGATPVYHKVHYLLLPAVICWFTLLFAVISSVVLFLASRHAVPSSTGAYPPYGDNASANAEVVDEKEKAKVAQQDV